MQLSITVMRRLRGIEVPSFVLLKKMFTVIGIESIIWCCVEKQEKDAKKLGIYCRKRKYEDGVTEKNSKAVQKNWEFIVGSESIIWCGVEKLESDAKKLGIYRWEHSPFNWSSLYYI